MDSLKEQLKSMNKDTYQMTPITLIPTNGYKRTNGDLVKWPLLISFLASQRKEVEEVAWYTSMNIATQTDRKFLILANYLSRRNGKLNYTLVNLVNFAHFNNDEIKELKKTQNNQGQQIRDLAQLHYYAIKELKETQDKQQQQITNLKNRVDALELQMSHPIAANKNFDETSIGRFS